MWNAISLVQDLQTNTPRAPPKMNVIARLEFELAYYDSAVQPLILVTVLNLHFDDNLSIYLSITL